MELPVRLQGNQALQAILLGLALGLAYDLLRGPRWLHRRLTGLWDLLWGVGFFCALWWFTLVPGEGLFRGFHGVGIFLGMSLWLSVGSQWFLRLWMGVLRRLEQGIAMILRPIWKILKKILEIAKKLFSSGGKWVKIACKVCRDATFQQSG